MHEYFFQGGLFDGHILNAHPADFLEHQVNITLEEEIQGSILHLNVGNTGYLEEVCILSLIHISEPTRPY